MQIAPLSGSFCYHKLGYKKSILWLQAKPSMGLQGVDGKKVRLDNQPLILNYSYNT